MMSIGHKLNRYNNKAEHIAKASTT